MHCTTKENEDRQIENIVKYIEDFGWDEICLDRFKHLLKEVRRTGHHDGWYEALDRIKSENSEKQKVT